MYDHTEIRTCYTSQDVIRDFKPVCHNYDEFIFIWDEPWFLKKCSWEFVKGRVAFNSEEDYYVGDNYRPECKILFKEYKYLTNLIIYYR